MNTLDSLSTINDQDLVDRPELPDVTPLHVLVQKHADLQNEVNKLDVELTQMEIAIQAMVQKTFPQYEFLQGELEAAKNALAISRETVKQKTLSVDDYAVKQFNGALIVFEKDVAVRFDKQKAIEFIRRNPAIALSAGLVKIEALQNDWLKAVLNGVQLPPEIILVDRERNVRFTKDKLKYFATIDTDNDEN